MNAPSPLNLTEVEQARIEADALVGAFDDHRAAMDPTSAADLKRERQLHRQASKAVCVAEGMESFQAHADQAIDLTGGQR